MDERGRNVMCVCTLASVLVVITFFESKGSIKDQLLSHSSKLVFSPLLIATFAAMS